MLFARYFEYDDMKKEERREARSRFGRDEWRLENLKKETTWEILT
jgi:hypothetical protein